MSRFGRVVFPLNRLAGEMDRLLGGLLPDLPQAGALAYSEGSEFPALNVWHDSENVYLEAESPGMKIEDLDIGIFGDEVTVRGERKSPHREGVAYQRRERGIGKFSRSVRLPVAIDADRADATLRDGVLTLTLPKSAAAKPRKIAVKSE